LLVAVPLLSFAGGRSYSDAGMVYVEVTTDPAERRRHQAELAVYLLVGLSVIGLGVLVEVLRGS
jgi:hypothetical protein